MEVKKREAAEAQGQGATLKTVAWGWFALWKADKDQAHIDRVESRLKNDIIPTLVTPEDERGEPLEPVSFGNRPMESRYYKF